MKNDTVLFDFLKLSKFDFLKIHNDKTEKDYEVIMNSFDNETQKALKSGIIELCTFPEDDANYCHCFSISVTNLLDILEKLDDANNQNGVNLDNFSQNYDWAETSFIYNQAQALKQVMHEYEQK